MGGAKPHLMICTCERTMPLDPQAVSRGCNGNVTRHDHLCGAELGEFRHAVSAGEAIVVACTQETPLFREVAESLSSDAPLSFANIRENGGWSRDAAAAGPKAAALIAAAIEEPPLVTPVTLESAGVALIYGCDDVAVEAGRQLADRLDITVLLTRPGDITPRAVNEFPVLKGSVRNAQGYLGRFELTIDDYALPAPSSREKLRFGPARDGAVSNCDLILDLSGGMPLFPAHELRPGYVRADPRDPLAVEKAIAEAGNLVGTFDKPLFIRFDASLCAHSRSKITGCTRCLDLCPTGAITPNGDAVAIDPAICGGCGFCAATCPTGAASYAVPPADMLMSRLRTLLQTYTKAGGVGPRILFHDGDHGRPLIDALARFGDGLPAEVIPVAVNEVSQVGPEAIAAAFAYGATGVTLLARERPRHDMLGMRQVVELSQTIVGSLGFGEDVVRIVQADDPDRLRAFLDAAPRGTAAINTASFVARGAKRGLLETAFSELHRAAPAPVDRIALPRGAPFGSLALDVESCTLCHSCVTACPTGALSDDPERPMLRFAESACVQCGLCAATCPEDALTLEPQLDFLAWSAPRRTLKQEEPFRCIACGEPFGTKSTIERVVARLEEKHWMFKGEHARRIDVVKMCDKCRVSAVVNEGFDPNIPQRPPVVTTDDYLRARETGADNPTHS
ncbi:4Fe-4S binding protein [Pseudaminobacter sp. NGMCC 1.201702]|uniref:4Fe-4S binding protein n=1 Tax=Pseudaminobacter sp. NGMCC 1.201702 TaxID=3391825 RepID=UPI0039F09156